jgi:hypothetical protein
MPRPTAAQVAYGSVTVVFSTLAMLLMSRTSSGIGVAVIGTAALALGLLVAMTVPLPKRSETAPAVTARTHHAVQDIAGIGTRATADRAARRVSELERVSEHSLRR